ncbi:MAG: cellulase family glycosylhydrolase [Myxococcota bacterium]
MRFASLPSRHVFLLCACLAACGSDVAVPSDTSTDDTAVADTAVADTTLAPDTATDDTSADSAAPADTVADSAIADDITDAADTATADADATADGDAGPSCTSPFIYMKDRQFMLGDEPYVPVSVNYIFDIRHDTDDHYYIAPHSAFCTTPAGCCKDAPSCLAAAREQLAQVKALGFNSLRIVGLAVIPEDGNLVLDCAHQWADWLDYCPKSAHLVMSPADERGFALIADALALVKEAGLHAIFLAGHHDVDADGIRDEYATYLTALAARFVDDPTIFAYDLTNEPVYEFAHKDIDKVDANAIGRAWYDAVRAGSPRAMVTMGLAEMGTVRHWDPGALPLDFTSFHVYASGKWNDADRDYLSMFLAWAGREPYPNMVGETGLSVEDGAPTEADQAAFAQHALTTAWDCGAMGLQWWLYRDVHWGPPGEHFGLVRWDGTARPAADAFGNFAATFPRPTCVAPDYTGSAPDGPFVATGRLVRENGTPVANGYVTGHRCAAGGWDWTISKADGTFELRSSYPVDQLEVTAAGLSLETPSAACNLVTPGDITLHALPLSLSVSTPSSCPP